MLESSLPFFMPPRSHSFILFLAVVLLIPAFCLLTSWQRRQKEDKIAVQFAELAASRPRTVGTPEQQRALLEALSRQYPGAAPSHSVPCIRIPLCFPEKAPADLFRRSSASFWTAAFWLFRRNRVKTRDFHEPGAHPHLSGR